MHVYKGVRLFALAQLSVHMCEEQIRAENTFPYIRLFQLSFIIRKYVQNISWNYHCIYIMDWQVCSGKMLNYHTTFPKKNVYPDML